jgi:hypothetical protein
MDKWEEQSDILKENKGPNDEMRFSAVDIEA